MDYWINIYNQLFNRSPQLRANSWPKWRFWRKKCPWKRTQSSVDGWLKIGWRNVVNFPPSPSSRSLGTVPNSQSRSPGTRVDIFNVHAIYHLDPFMHEHSLIYIYIYGILCLNTITCIHDLWSPFCLYIFSHSFTLRPWQYDSRISEYYVILEESTLQNLADIEKRQEATELGVP